MSDPMHPDLQRTGERVAELLKAAEFRAAWRVFWEGVRRERRRADLRRWAEDAQRRIAEAEAARLRPEDWN